MIRLCKTRLKDRYAFLKSKGLCFCVHETRDTRKTILSTEKHFVLNARRNIHSFFTWNHENRHLKVIKSTRKRDNPSSLATNSTTHMGAGETLVQAFPILPVRLKHIDSDKHVETYAFLDCGSNATFCSEKIMRELNLRGQQTKLSLKNYGSSS